MEARFPNRTKARQSLNLTTHVNDTDDGTSWTRVRFPAAPLVSWVESLLYSRPGAPLFRGEHRMTNGTKRTVSTEGNPMNKLRIADLDQEELDHLVRTNRLLQADYDALFTDYQLQKAHKFITYCVLIVVALWEILK